MKHLLPALIVIITICSCTTQADKQKDNSIYVDIEKRDQVSLFDIFSHVEVIPLETTEESLIKGVNKLIFHDDIHYILDYRNSEILLFDTNGKYINKISDRGDGPKQYLNISDFEIDDANSQISVLAPVNNSMYEYDLEGDFAAKYKLPNIMGAYRSFISLNKDTIVYFTFDYDNRIKLYSKSENRIVKELFPEKENILNNFSNYIFPYANYLHRSASNTLYKIENKGAIIDGYTWDFGKLNNSISQLRDIKKIPYNDLRQHFRQLINSEIINQVMILHGGNSKYRFTQMWRKGKHLNVFHDRINSKNFVFEKTTENATFHPLSWHEDYVIGYYSDESGEREETIPDAILDDKNTKIIKQWNEYDNPILVKYYFK